MKLTAWVEQEVEISLTASEVIEGIQVSLRRPQTKAELLDLLNSMVSLLRACPDYLLTKLEPEPRELVGAALLEQAGRFGAQPNPEEALGFAVAYIQTRYLDLHIAEEVHDGLLEAWRKAGGIRG